MEEWNYRELESFKIGGFPITIAKARGQHFVAFVGSGTCETEEDTRKAALKYRANLDKKLIKSDNTG